MEENTMENNQGKKIMETENTKDVEVDLEQVGDKVVGGTDRAHACEVERIVEDKADQLRHDISVESLKVECDLRRKVSLGDFAYAK